jgi:hypothetical protein
MALNAGVLSGQIIRAKLLSTRFAAVISNLIDFGEVGEARGVGGHHFVVRVEQGLAHCGPWCIRMSCARVDEIVQLSGRAGDMEGCTYFLLFVVEDEEEVEI